ncbi:hypothetical protein FACS1894110_13990 [Spirochaetia bacterium]|nr:hypothetical protein FACS1894110_13990 [Spirochaetia bacterium]
MNFKRIHEATRPRDIVGLTQAIMLIGDKDIGTNGLVEIGPDQPIIHKGPVMAEVIKDNFLFTNESIAVLIRIIDISSAEAKNDEKTYWSVLMKNGQEFAIDLR